MEILTLTFQCININALCCTTVKARNISSLLHLVYPYSWYWTNWFAILTAYIIIFTGTSGINDCSIIQTRCIFTLCNNVANHLVFPLVILFIQSLRNYCEMKISYSQVDKTFLIFAFCFYVFFFIFGLLSYVDP